MRRIVLVTPTADPRLLDRYLNSSEFIGLDEGTRIIKEAGINPYAAVSDFRSISLAEVLSYLPKNRVFRYQPKSNGNLEEVYNFLVKNNPVEIVILTDLKIHLNILYSHLLTLATKSITISLQDYDACISFLRTGDHVISKQNYTYLTLIGFPEARVTLEHVRTPIVNKSLLMGKTPEISTEITERIAVLKVLDGGVLVVLNNDE